MDVTIMLDNGTAAVVSWAMDGLVEGIDLRTQEQSTTSLGTDETDATTTQAWRRFADQTIRQVGVAWHVPNEGCPETLWAVRLSFSGGAAIAVALGQVEADSVQYQPDALVVLFGETAARAYRPAASPETAFGSVLDP